MAVPFSEGSTRTLLPIMLAAVLGFALSFVFLLLLSYVHTGVLISMLVYREGYVIDSQKVNAQMIASTASLGSFWFWATVFVLGLFTTLSIVRSLRR